MTALAWRGTVESWLRRMRLLNCWIILITIGRNGMFCYICHVYTQDVRRLVKEEGSGLSEVPKSVMLAANCSICFGVIYREQFISGCRREGWQESKTLNEHFGIMCNRNPTYCGPFICCCTSTTCYDDLRQHFLQSVLRPNKGTICDVYRQTWVENSREKGLNKSVYPAPGRMYRRTNCAACGSRADEEGVEMTCIEEDVDITCSSMNLFVGGAVACSGSGDCCCQGKDCTDALRNFYSGNQKLLGPPTITGPIIASSSRFHSNLITVAISLFMTVF